MKSKILSFSILKETTKKQVWVPALIMLGFFLSFPVMGMVYLELLQSGHRTEAEIIEAYTRLIAGTRFPFLTMMTMGSAVLAGVSGFSWLHSKIKTDFYHSLPVRREKLFLGQVILGIAYFVVPYLINLLLAYVVGIVHGVLRGGLIRMSLLSFLYQCLFYLLMYLVVVLAMLLTGKVVVGVLGAFVLTFYGPVVSLLLQGLGATFFDTYASGETLLKKVLENLSPAVAYFTYQPDNSFEVPGRVWAVGLLAAAALIVVCFFLYKKRPSEAADRTMAFGRLGRVIQYLMEVMVVLLSGLFFYTITSRGSLGWLIFGVLLGGVLFHGIMEVIYEGDIRRVMGHAWIMGASMVTTLLVIGIFYGDLFGYDDYLPAQDKLKSVSIQVGSSSSGELNEEQRASMEKLAADPQVYEVLQGVVKDRLMQIATVEGVEHRRQDGTEAEEIRSISVVYGLSGGRRAYREYYVDFGQYRQELMALYDSPEYKKTVYPLATMSEAGLEGLEQVEVVSIMGSYTPIFAENIQARAEFLKIYRAELMQMSAETLEKERPVGRLAVTAAYDTEMGWLASGPEDNGYLIYPSFTKTLAALREQGVELPEDLCAEDVKSVKVYDYRENKSRLDAVQEKEIQDRNQIEKILPALVSTECRNSFMEYEDGIDVMVEIQSKGYDYNITCLVRKGQMPKL